MQNRNSPPPVCPNCGADVPPKALACPECGSDHDTGWKDYADVIGQGSPEDEFDYAEAFDKEFGREVIPSNTKPIWWITAIVIVVVFIAGLIKVLL